MLQKVFFNPSVFPSSVLALLASNHEANNLSTHTHRSVNTIGTSLTGCNCEKQDNFGMLLTLSSMKAPQKRTKERLLGSAGRSLVALNASSIYVLHDDLRLAYWLPLMDEHGNLLVHWVEAKKAIALVAEVLLYVLVAQALEAEGKSHAQHERARPHAKQLQLITSSGHCHACMLTRCRLSWLCC
jgi:hypothetical protein